MNVRVREELNYVYFECFKTGDYTRAEFMEDVNLCNSLLKKISKPEWTEENTSYDYR